MIKVHFAGSDNQASRIVALKASNVQYRLFTCYPFIESKRPGQNMRVDSLLEATPGLYKHTILDSGLFTLMFGAKSDTTQSEETIIEWQQKLVQFVRDNNLKSAVVECDCQKVISPEFAWECRQELRRQLPDNEIINVYHIEDGQKGFERLCEFADYIAISVPELRIYQPKNYRRNVCGLARLARKLKPEIKIHLLGCTEIGLLKKNQFCTTSDSSSWLSPLRYGFMKGHHISALKPSVLEEKRWKCQSTAEHWGIKLSPRALADAAKATVCASFCREQYEKALGPGSQS